MLDVAISLSPVHSGKPTAVCFYVVAISLTPYARIILALSTVQHILKSKSHSLNAHINITETYVPLMPQQYHSQLEMELQWYMSQKLR